MPIEISYYAVEWKRLEDGVKENKSLDFFFDAMDEEDDLEGGWESWIEVPSSELWGNCRASEDLASQIAQSTAIQQSAFRDKLMKLFIGLAIIPDPTTKSFTPCAGLGKPGSVSEDYLGALNPQTAKEFLSLAEELEAGELINALSSDNSLPKDSLVRLIPNLIRDFRRFLQHASEHGWCLLITAS